jgi:hypothetical protein
MMTSHTSTTTATATRRLGQPYVAAILALAGATMLAAGVWAGLAPRSFARLVAFPYHQHYLHDLGALQIGIGVTLLPALAWRDAETVALAGFLVANTLHAVSRSSAPSHGHPGDRLLHRGDRGPQDPCTSCSSSSLGHGEFGSPGSPTIRTGPGRSSGHEGTVALSDHPMRLAPLRRS